MCTISNLNADMISSNTRVRTRHHGVIGGRLAVIECAQARCRRLLNAVTVPLLFVAMSIASAAVFAQMPNDMRAELQSNATNLDPCRAEWKMRRVSPLAIAQISDLLGRATTYRDDASFLAEEKATCCIDGNRILVRFEFQDLVLESLGGDVDPAKVDPKTIDMRKYVRISGYAKGVSELSFDGSHVFLGDHRENGHPDTLMVYSREYLAKQSRESGLTDDAARKRWRHNYWYEAGFEVPTNEYAYADPHVKSLVLHLADGDYASSEYGSSQLDGREYPTVTITTARGKHIFYLDPQRHHAVRRREDYDSQGRRQAIANASQFNKISQCENLWLPSEISVEYFQWYGKPEMPRQEPLFESRYTLVLFDKVKSSPETFELKYQGVGTVVGDGRLPTAKESTTGLVHYQVPADPHELDAAIQHAIDTASREPRRKKWFWIGLNIVIIWALGTAIWCTKNRRGSA